MVETLGCSPTWGGARVRLSLWYDSGYRPKTSEVGTDLRAIRLCGGPCLRTWRFRRHSPTWGGARVRLSLWYDSGYRPKASEVGTDLRAVRHRRRGHFQRHRPTQGGGSWPRGPRRPVAAVGRDGVSPSAPEAARRGEDGPRDSSPTGEALGHPFPSHCIVRA